MLKENSFTLSSLSFVKPDELETVERFCNTNILVPSVLKRTSWGLTPSLALLVAWTSWTISSPFSSVCTGPACAELTKVRLKIKNIENIENIFFIKLSILIKIYLIETS